jgi:hypothetical protein
VGLGEGICVPLHGNISKSISTNGGSPAGIKKLLLSRGQNYSFESTVYNYLKNKIIWTLYANNVDIRSSSLFCAVMWLIKVRIHLQFLLRHSFSSIKGPLEDSLEGTLCNVCTSDQVTKGDIAML